MDGFGLGDLLRVQIQNKRLEQTAHFSVDMATTVYGGQRTPDSEAHEYIF